MKVSISQPANTSNLVGIKKGDDFYFFAKPDWPTKEFDVKYTVSLVKSKCVLKTPASPTRTTKTKGGLIIPYLVEYQVPGEKKIKGEIYFIPVRIKEVSFSGNNYSELRHYTSAPIYNAPHWRDNNEDGDVGDNPHTKEEDRQFSVAYVANQRAEISANFVAVGLPADAGIKIAVTLDDTNGIADIEQASVNQAEGIITLPATKTKHPFAKTVAFYDRFNNKPFKGTWKVHFDKVSLEAGLTEHQIYVSLKKPNLKPEMQFEDIFYNACKRAQGLKDEDKIVEAIWDEFKDREVSRYELERGKDDVDTRSNNAVKGKGMIYWNPNQPIYRTLPDLMKSGDASCDIWSLFLGRVCDVHQIKTEQVNFLGKKLGVVDFLASTLFYKEQFKFDNTVYYYSYGVASNLPEAPVGTPKRNMLAVRANQMAVGERLIVVSPAPNHSMSVTTRGIFYVNKTNITEPFIDLPQNNKGFPGGASVSQGNPNARAWFYDHQIMKYQGKLWDASYGGAIHEANGNLNVKKVYEQASFESHGFYAEVFAMQNAPNNRKQLGLVGSYLYYGLQDEATIEETQK